MAKDLRVVAGRDLRNPGHAGVGGPTDQHIFELLGMAAWVWDIQSDRLSWSDNAAALLGIDRLERIATGAAYRKAISARSPQGREEIFLPVRGAQAADCERPFTLRYELSLPGGLMAVEDSGKAVLGENGRIVRAAGLLRPIHANAAHALDGAAGLTTAARSELMGWLGEAFTRAKFDGQTFGLMVFSVAGFSLIEDTSGSETAEQVATAIMARLRGQLRRTDKALRYAANRFAILLTRATLDGLRLSAERLAAHAGAEPIATDAGLAPVRVHGGCILGPNFARDPRTLLRRGEEAMEKARRRGRPFAVYEPDRRGEAARQKSQTLSDNVMRALESGRLVIARQPVVHAATYRIAFEEALLRIVQDDGSVVGAGEVIPTFERLGRIELLDMRVLDLVVQTLRAEPATRLSVNVSAETLRAGPWMSQLADAIGGDRALAARLLVEMTESQAIDDEAVAKRAFTQIRALGARTAIDDFGAGYTSFRHLRGLDVDIVKIDGGFVKNVGVSADDTFFVRTLVDLARHLGIETVAEWVRDRAAADLLASFGVDFLQGDCLGPARIIAPVGLGGFDAPARGAA